MYITFFFYPQFCISCGVIYDSVFIRSKTINSIQYIVPLDFVSLYIYVVHVRVYLMQLVRCQQKTHP